MHINIYLLQIELGDELFTYGVDTVGPSLMISISPSTSKFSIFRLELELFRLFIFFIIFISLQLQLKDNIFLK